MQLSERFAIVFDRVLVDEGEGLCPVASSMIAVIETYLTPEAVPSNIEVTLAVMCRVTSFDLSEKVRDKEGARPGRRHASQIL